MNFRDPKAYILPIALAIGHTLVIEAATWIQLNDAWNDMNPTMLVLIALRTADAPVIWMLEELGVRFQIEPGTFLFSLKLLGGFYWLAIGFLLTLIGAGTARTTAAPQPRGHAVH